MDIVSKSKALTDEISSLIKQEQEIKNRVKEYKRLIDDKKIRLATVHQLLAEEAALIAELND
jgi:hypothetical protein